MLFSFFPYLWVLSRFWRQNISIPALVTLCNTLFIVSRLIRSLRRFRELFIEQDDSNNTKIQWTWNQVGVPRLVGTKFANELIHIAESFLIPRRGFSCIISCIWGRSHSLIHTLTYRFIHMKSIRTSRTAERTTITSSRCIPVCLLQYYFGLYAADHIQPNTNVTNPWAARFAIQLWNSDFLSERDRD